MHRLVNYVEIVLLESVNLKLCLVLMFQIVSAKR
jgi:hypothetical protein